ncbi:DNA-binding domain-containing protein [Arenimonas oryziterrae]|uniref:Uncharacterized protein n=1 Tax=Arenimonas oryziterrae DSM 21050 = YC6267 TaxID=1121015 RepID=A0A091AMA3_9GAMM|nr:putative DNA-binding domain-containing protein [Arenimonas oryziterrae]KFN41333.1 hypothetical protein N789_05510 [Arenimonas oryziterrae DSM 21050 = YC6267]
MSAPDALHGQQAVLAAHLRDPRQPPPPGLEARRVAIYRELFFDNIEGLLAGNFPVLRRLFAGERWQTLVRGFCRDHRSLTPLFTEVAREFLRYLDTVPVPDDAPWLRELAHYEWVELALELSEATLSEASATTAPASIQDPLDDVPKLSPLAWPLAYTWPVHQICKTYWPRQTPTAPTFLLVQRDPNHRVRFHEIDALSFRLLQMIEDHPARRAREHLDALAQEAQPDDRAAFLANGASLLTMLETNHVLLSPFRRNA